MASNRVKTDNGLLNIEAIEVYLLENQYVDLTQYAYILDLILYVVRYTMLLAICHNKDTYCVQAT